MDTVLDQSPTGLPAITVTLEIPEELAQHLGSEALRMSRHALGLEAHRRGLWTEAELGQFLGPTRISLDRFLKDHGIDLSYTWQDLERERTLHWDLTGV